MQFTVAIQPDHSLREGGHTTYCERWAPALEAAGSTVRWVDLLRSDAIEQLDGCDALLWRFNHLPSERAHAQRLLTVAEREMDLVVFPDRNTCWYYDDKIAQAYLFQVLKIPAPPTWVFWRLEDALDFCRTASYPLVAKLAGGASSENVRTVDNRHDAESIARWMFGRGLHSTKLIDGPGVSLGERVRNAARWLLRGRGPHPGMWWELHKDYVLFQEFLPGNDFDTRINIIGERAFGRRRFNRPGDFRASGSGLNDVDPSTVDLAMVRLSYRAARALGTQSCAIDWLYRDGEPVIGEVSYTCVPDSMYRCPGHWELYCVWP